MEPSEAGRHVRYAADEKPPAPLAFGLGLQLAMLTIAGIVLTPSIVIRAGGGSDSYLSRAAFAAVAVGGYHDNRPGSARRPHRRRLRPADGHLRRVHRRLYRGDCRGRSGPACHACRHFVALPVRAGGASVPGSPHFHAVGRRHRHHADRGHGHADCLRRAGQGAGGGAAACGSRVGCCHHGRYRRHCARRNRGLAPQGPGHRRGGGIGGRRRIRHLRP